MRACTGPVQQRNRTKPAWLAKGNGPCHTAAARRHDQQARMTLRRPGVAVCLFALALTGCVTPKAYVENGHDKADYRELFPRNPPTQVQVVAEFRINGQPHPEVNTAVFNEVVKVLQQTRVLQPVNGDPGLTLHVTVDDIADLDAASSSGWSSGLTEGLSGNLTRDDYHFKYSLQGHSGLPQTGLYHHAMITVTGRAVPPSYGQAHTTNQAFAIIVKQSVLEYLHDFQGIKPDAAVMLVPDVTEPREGPK